MADQYNDQPRHRHRDTQHDQFEPQRNDQHGEGSDRFGDERGRDRADRSYDPEFGRSHEDRDHTRSYPQDRDRLAGSRHDEDARWGTMEGREWGAERHNRMGGGRSGRPNPDPVPPLPGTGRSRGGHDDSSRSYSRGDYRDDHEARDYGARGYRRGGRDRDPGFFDQAGDEVSSWFGDDDAERRRRENHRGRGPANYRRSNERLLEDACERLTHDPRIDARQITVTAKDHEITLDGHVSSRSEKREAEDCVHEISGVKHVQNNLRIGDLDDRSDTGRSESSRTDSTKTARK